MKNVSRLPPDTFEHYVALGLDRSYQAVADHFGVSKVSIVKRAKKENWQIRLRELEKKAQERSEQRAMETLDAVRGRQLKVARLLQARALEALRRLSPEKAVKAAAAVSIGWKHELLLLGEPTDRSAVSIEELIKREYQSLMRPAGENEWPEQGAGEGGPHGSAA
mgnify:CR=1 FL=1